jgi:hypothetical protein
LGKVGDVEEDPVVIGLDDEARDDPLLRVRNISNGEDDCS